MPSEDAHPARTEDPLWTDAQTRCEQDQRRVLDSALAIHANVHALACATSVAQALTADSIAAILAARQPAACPGGPVTCRRVRQKTAT